jgi:hypothetical protein
MSQTTFFDRADYREYIRLLAELHGLIVSGQDEASEGERLREQMDASSEHFSDAEIASLHGISADLYSLAETAAPARPKTPQAQHDLLEAMLAARSGDYIKALELLRRNQAMIEPSLLSYMRGQIFADAGLAELANRFFEHASTLEPAHAAHG